MGTAVSKFVIASRVSLPQGPAKILTPLELKTMAIGKRVNAFSNSSRVACNKDGLRAVELRLCSSSTLARKSNSVATLALIANYSRCV